MEFSEILKRHEAFYESARESQILDPESIWYGSYGYLGNHGIIPISLPLYIQPESKYYKDPEVLRRMELSIDFCLRMQFPNGLISLWNCNIVSPPDTGFVINSLSVVLNLLDKLQLPELESLRQKVSTFLELTIPGMVTGGFHTPNHRWVMTCALSFLYRRFGNPELLDRIQQFLAEGLDINASGEWTERSNAVYNGVSDLFCYHIGENLGDDSIFEAVRKNLDMMQYLLHPNDCVATEYSTRQDRGTVQFMGSYYTLVYTLMAIKDQNPYYAHVAEIAIGHAESYDSYLIDQALYAEEFKKIPVPKPISDHYTVLFNEGNTTQIRKKKSSFGDPVLRHRQGKLSITLMAGQPEFLFLQYGKARAFNIKFPLAWFGMGGVSFPGIEKLSDNRYRLYTPVYGDYLDVFPAEQAAPYGGNWDRMPNHTERKRVNQVETAVEIYVTLQEDGVDLDITTDKLPYIFTQLVCMMDPDGTVSGDRLKTMRNGAMMPEGGYALYQLDGDCISIRGEATGHDLDFLRGDVFDEKAQNIILNALSPKDWHIEIRCFDQ